MTATVPAAPAQEPRNLIVIGGGAAAYSAAIYAARANLRPLVIEGSLWGWGGQLMRAARIENYPGYPESVQGPALISSLREQAERYGAEFVAADVSRVDLHPERLDGLKEVWVGDTRYRTREVVIATGASARRLGLDSETRMTGRGVAYCTTCEAHDHHAVVVGGGDSAFTDALTLALFVRKVTLIHRRGSFAASPIMVERAHANPKIEILTDRVVRDIVGSDWVEAVMVEHLPSGRVEAIACDGLFVAIGHTPNSTLFAGQLQLDRNGYLRTEPGSTEMLGDPGIYAAGDVADDRYQQAVTAAAAGCMAGMDATRSFARGGHASLAEAGQDGGDAAAAFAGAGRIVVLIPAHNEESLIATALASIEAQTRPADEVIVVADRCTDGTCRVVDAHGATVRTTIDNHDKKAGALNQMLSHLLPRLSANDAVLIMDADSTIAPGFLEFAERKLREEPAEGQAEVGGVGGIFLGSPLTNFIERIQNNEYLRYAVEIGRRKGRADVLTGTATLFSAKALRDVLRARRSGTIPQAAGVYVYDVEAQTEDNELTLALKHLGYRCVSPKECLVGTEVMPNTKRLYLQRLRWQRGALENIQTYGVTRQTLPYIGKQILTYLGIIFVPFFLTTLAYTWATTGGMPWSWLWLTVGGVVGFERIWSVRRGGWKALAIAAAIIPEVLYDQFLHGVYVKSFTDIVTDARERWDHTTPVELVSVRSWRRWWNRLLELVVTGAPLTGTIAVAIVCAKLGIAWPAIGAFVSLGMAQAMLRLSNLDPFRHLGNGELGGHGGPPVPRLSGRLAALAQDAQPLPAPAVAATAD